MILSKKTADGYALIYNDLDFDFNKTLNNDISVLSNLNAIKESIRNIINTPRGASLMDPTFGCGIHSYIFTQLDSITKSVILDMIRQDLLSQEPRIKINYIDINYDNLNETTLLLKIIYTLKDNNIEDIFYTTFESFR